MPRFLYWIEDIFTVLASTYSTLNSVRGPTPADANPRLYAAKRI